MNKTVLSVCLAASTALAGCLIVDDTTDGTGGTAGSGASSSNSSGTGASGGTGGTGGTAGNGTGGATGMCEFVEQCNTDLEGDCLCLGCDAAACTDVDGNAAADCVCAVCAGEEYCNNPDNCVDNGACDPLNEGCLCNDCAGHPECL